MNKTGSFDITNVETLLFSFASNTEFQVSANFSPFFSTPVICVLENTKILLENNKQKKIQDIDINNDKIFIRINLKFLKK